jgi:hypothetical protein
MGVLAAWGLFGWVVGLVRSPGWWQRGVCGDCGRRFWQRAGRCAVCAERYHVAADRATMDVCLTCGHERAGRLARCPRCRQKEVKHRRSPVVGAVESLEEASRNARQE